MSVIKRITIAALSTIFAIEVAAFGGLVFVSQGAYASAAEEIAPTAVVSDVAYKPIVEEVAVVNTDMATNGDVVTDEKVSEDDVWREESEATSGTYEQSGEYYYDYSADYVTDDYNYTSSGLIPYDGSGYYDANLNGAWHSGADFAFSGGDGYDDGSGFSYTWYSENVLPGGGLSIPGRHVGDEGYVMDESGNVCLASDYLPEGTIVNIPFGSGTGVVYDSGSGYSNLDVYVSW